jgi:hypothetical protein
MDGQVSHAPPLTFALFPPFTGQLRKETEPDVIFFFFLPSTGEFFKISSFFIIQIWK